MRNILIKQNNEDIGRMGKNFFGYVRFDTGKGIVLQKGSIKAKNEYQTCEIMLCKQDDKYFLCGATANGSWAAIVINEDEYKKLSEQNYEKMIIYYDELIG